MLKIIVPGQELYDQKNNKFITKKDQELKLEHSLLSISKWEAKWKKPFLVSKPEKTKEEILDYIKCMSTVPVNDDSVFYRLTKENMELINAYIQDPMTATWFNDSKTKNSREIVTSEVIYAQMIGLGIPIEFEKWHINRLTTLIRVCDIKFNKGTKMSKKEIYKSNKELNEARRKKMNSKG